MKNKIYLVLFFVIVSLLTYNSSLFSEAIAKPKKEIIKEEKKIKVNKVKTKRKTFKQLLEKVAFFESSNRWNITKGQYIGKYQFGRSALKDLKIDKKISVVKFKRNPNIFPEKEQDKQFKKWLDIQWVYLKPIHSKLGSTINGIKLTKSGLCAASHLVGHTWVLKYVESNGRIIKKDGNGTSLEKYLKELSNYTI